MNDEQRNSRTVFKMQLNFQKTGGSYGAGNLTEHLPINRLPLPGKTEKTVIAMWCCGNAT
jgi:hypothetical protein